MSHLKFKTRLFSNSYEPLLFYVSTLFLSWIFLLFFNFTYISTGQFEVLIDSDILDYGNLVAAYLNDFINISDIKNFQVEDREKGELILFPFMALFFSFFDLNYYSVHIFAILFNSLLPLTWYQIARTLNQDRHKSTFPIFLIGTPYFFFIKISPQFNFTHTGATLFFSLSLLFLLSFNKKFNPLYLIFSAAFLATSWIYGLISVPISIGAFYLAIKLLNSKHFLAWLGSFTLFFTVLFSLTFTRFLPPLMREFSENVASISHLGWALYSSTKDVLFSMFFYFGGYTKNLSKAETIYAHEVVFSLGNIFFALFIITLAIISLKIRPKVSNQDFSEKKSTYFFNRSLIISSTTLVVTIVLLDAVSLFDPLETFDIEGLRYFIPLIPIYLYFINYFLNSLINHKSSYYFFSFTYLLINLFFLFSILFPFHYMGDHYKNIKGFNGIPFISHTKNDSHLKQRSEASHSSYLKTFALMKGRSHIYHQCQETPAMTLIKEKNYELLTPTDPHLASLFLNGLGIQASHHIKFKDLGLDKIVELDPSIFEGIIYGLMHDDFENQNRLKNINQLLNLTRKKQNTLKVYHESLLKGIGRYLHLLPKDGQKIVFKRVELSKSEMKLISRGQKDALKHETLLNPAQKALEEISFFHNSPGHIINAQRNEQCL